MKEAAFVKNDHAVGGKCWILEHKEKAKCIKKSYTSLRESTLLPLSLWENTELLEVLRLNASKKAKWGIKKKKKTRCIIVQSEKYT